MLFFESQEIPKIDTPSSIEQSPSLPIVQQSQNPQTGKRTNRKSKAAAAQAAAQAIVQAAQMQEQLTLVSYFMIKLI